MVEIFTLIFWVALFKVVWIDILLSGDNALVIAMACRNLGERRTLGMILGAGAAVVLRTIATGLIVILLQVPYLKIVGALALLVVAVKMLLPEEDKVGDNPSGTSTMLLEAVLSVVIADIVMSIDNVIAVAAAANGSLLLIGIGLALSIPIVVGGAAIISTFLGRFPILVWLGGGLLGWIAGDVFGSDPFIASHLYGQSLLFLATFGAVLVPALAFTLRRPYDVARKAD